MLAGACLAVCSCGQQYGYQFSVSRHGLRSVACACRGVLCSDWTCQNCPRFLLGVGLSFRGVLFVYMSYAACGLLAELLHLGLEQLHYRIVAVCYLRR